MRVLLIGVGGVGESIAKIAQQRDPASAWLEKMVLADFNEARASEIAGQLGDSTRFPVERIDASQKDQVIALAKKYRVDVVMNAVDPLYNMAIFDGAFEVGVNYIDMASSLSQPHPTDPYNKCGVMLADEQWAKAKEWEEKGLLAMLGCGIEPGLSDFYAKYAEKYFFDKIEEMGVRDGNNLHIPGSDEVTWGFSIWTLTEECLNPPVVFEADNGGFHTTQLFSDPEPFWLPEGIGTVEMVNVEHVEAIYIGRHIGKGLSKATFKYALGEKFIEALKVIQACRMHLQTPVDVKGTKVVPLDVLGATTPNPVEVGMKYVGKTAAGTWAKGTKDGLTREIYLYQIADNEECIERLGCQSVVAQTAFTPVMLMELMAAGKWNYAGVRCGEMCDPEPVVGLLADYGFPGGLLEMDSEYRRAREASALLMPVEASSAAAPVEA
jgi:saccharopine dehydrogenase (NAD+, L-lysine-forming)